MDEPSISETNVVMTGSFFVRMTGEPGEVVAVPITSFDAKPIICRVIGVVIIVVSTLSFLVVTFFVTVTGVVVIASVVIVSVSVNGT